jgi:5-methylthioadenosine/S-adenosylhomocysteine deaminase
MRTRIENVTILTCDSVHTVYKNSSITFEHDKIIAINELIPTDKIIDGKNGILLPGFINVHAHLSMIPFRSLQDDLSDRLRLFLFPLEKETMTKELAVASAKVGVAESLLSGVTTIFDMYYYAEALATLYNRLGIRAVVAQTILNQPLCDAQDEDEGIALASTFFKKWENHPLIRPAFGPHSTMTVTKKGLEKIQSFSTEHNARVCMHVSEMEYEMDYFQKQNISPIEYLENLELLNSKFTAVHTIHLSDHDIQIIKKHKVGIAHCIGANTKAAKGIAPLVSLLKNKVNVGLGTDGPSSGNTLDLFVQMNLVAKIHKVINHDRSILPAKKILHLATLSAAKVLHLEDKIGSLEVGKQADLVLMETQSINMFPIHDPFSVMVYSANPSNVESVWVNGIQKVNNKSLVDCDVNQIKKECMLLMQPFLVKVQEIEANLPKKIQSF